MTAVIHGDAPAVADVFDENAKLLVPGLNAVAGRTAIQQFWTQVLAGDALARLELVPDDVTETGPDSAVETGVVTVIDRSGKATGRSNYVLVWNRRGGEWRIFRDIASPAATVPVASLTDRVGFPAEYRTRLARLEAPKLNGFGQVQTLYANETADRATRGHTLPYPHGSVLVMEFAGTVRDEAGRPALDPEGHPQRGEILHVDVMRHESGFGAAYGEKRAGEWEFASYRADGSPALPPVQTVSCAECHQTVGAANDFVFPVAVQNGDAPRDASAVK